MDENPLDETKRVNDRSFKLRKSPTKFSVRPTERNFIFSLN